MCDCNVLKFSGECYNWLDTEFREAFLRALV